MHKYIFYTLASIGILHAQDLQKIADTLPVSAQLKADQKSLPIPRAKGVSVRFLGADYEEVISANGQIRPVISDTVVRVSFEVSKDGKKAISKDYPIIIQPSQPAQAGTNNKPVVIPELLQWRGGEEQLDMSNASFTATSSDDNKLATRFATEVDSLRKKPVENAADALTIDFEVMPKLKARLGDEGYRILIKPKGITVKAATQRGLYWSTRSILQILKTNDFKIPCGEIVDFPRFKIRGFMFDAARTPYALNYLEDIVDTMSWYKLNDFHINLNNNYIFHEKYVKMKKDPFVESYAGYRIESDYVSRKGETLHSQDLHYTKKQFAAFIKESAEKGVSIVPEINSPAHALSFTRMRPDLIYQGPMGNKADRRCEMLDASNPATLRFVSSILDEYLLPDKKLGRPVFEDLVIHVGADEFYGAAEDYRKYTDSILKYVLKRGYQPRLWGSLNTKKGNTPVIAKGVQLNLWNAGWAKAWDSINQGFDIINANDGALYIVPFADYYRMDKNQRWVYEKFEPNRIANEVVPSGHPQFLGATFAVWNDMIDMDHAGYHFADIESTINHSIDIVAQKTWGSVRVPRNFDQHRKLVDEVIGHHPVKKPTSVTIEKANMEVPFALNQPALMPPYRLSVELELDASSAGKEQILLSDGKAAIYAAMADGKVGFRRDDVIDFAYDYKLPVGKRVKLELVGTVGKTQLFVDGELVADRPTLLTFQSAHKEKITTTPLPLKEVGKKFDGKIYSLKVK